MVSHLKVGLLLTTVSTVPQKTSPPYKRHHKAKSAQMMPIPFFLHGVTKAPGTNSKHTV